MKITVYGLGYLGIAYSTWLHLAGISARMLDVNTQLFDGIKLETGLSHHWSQFLRPQVTHDYADCKHSDLVLFTYDTPIDAKGTADIEYIFDKVDKLIENITNDALIVICSQLPVGSIAKMEAKHPNNRFCYIPENVRVGKALEYLTNLDRIVLGTRRKTDEIVIRMLLDKLNLTSPIITMSPESAEMTKHTINAFLGMNIAFINEIAKVCNVVGADVNDITRGIKSEYRIGNKLPLAAGGPFKSGHLERDLEYLSDISNSANLPSDILKAITISNNRIKSIS